MGILPQKLEDKAALLLATCGELGITVAIAESCTGGLVSAAITAIPGSSAWMERGFVTYSNEAKTQMLGVPAETIAEFGAVSEETAKAMAEGAVRNSDAVAAVAITGIAGPSGGTPTKPVGLVHFAAAFDGQDTLTARYILPGDRGDIRLEAAMTALDLLIERIRTAS